MCFQPFLTGQSDGCRADLAQIFHIALKHRCALDEIKRGKAR